ncbi:MAG: hypothetical protein QF903_14035 [Planctomycetota bacterium]|jgi:hypothetical protein|nr:hypothetical protein [Planctomycetota bacterium]MDP6763205.1 hypothetical protein [Planctomycetota bacterium]MDP6990586.1 hypothetical protein [Planctomycetota bacterium]
MSSTSIVPIVSAALAGTVAAVVTSVVLSTGEEGGSRVVDGGPDLDALRGEVEALRLGNEELAGQLGELEISLALGSPRVPADLPDLAQLQEQLDQLIATTTQDGPVVVTAQLRSGVTAVLDEIKLKEDQERERRRQEARERRMDQQMDRLSERLGLDSVQAGDMRTILVEQDLKREELFAAAREFGGRDEVQGLMQGLREETLQSLAQVLTPEQLEQYREQSTDRDRPGRGRGARRGGGN